MHEYDATLKSILTRSAGKALAEITGLEIARWLSTDLPAVRHRRADLLGETATRKLLHLELQSTNQTHMARRMLEYSLAIHRKFHRLPEQIVVYVGNPPLRMKGRVSGPRLSFECRIMDIREIDSEPLLASDSLEDNVFGILARVGNQREAVRRVLRRIAAAWPSERSTALADLMVLAGLRKLGSVLKQETEQMPILDDIMDHEIIGPARREGARAVILRQIDKRFGPLPDWAKARLDAMTPAEYEKIELRLLDAPTIAELLNFDPATR